MLSIRVMHQGMKTPLARFLLNCEIPLEDKRIIMQGAYIHFNNITTLVTCHDHWLEMCRVYSKYTLHVKPVYMRRTRNATFPVGVYGVEDANDAFDTVPRGDGWVTFKDSRDMLNILTTNRPEVLAENLSIPLYGVR